MVEGTEVEDGKIQTWRFKFLKNFNIPGVAQSVLRQGYGMDEQGSIIGRRNDGNFFLATGSGAHSVSYHMGTGNGLL